MHAEGRPPNGGGPHVDWPALREAVRESALNVGLVHLPTRRFIELSGPAASLLGLDGADLGALDVVSLSADPESTRRALDLVSEGALDGYQTLRTLQARSGAAVELHVSVRVVARDDKSLHGLLFVDEGDARADVEADGFDTEAALIVGIVSGSGTVEGISSDVEPAAGRAATDVVLHPLLDLVHPGDIAIALGALKAASDPGSQASVLVRVHDGSGRWHQMRLVLARFGDGTGRSGFALGPVDERVTLDRSIHRVAELEQRMRRIAREIEAAGIIDGFEQLPDAETFPALRDLTSRQWEIITRLLRGERVPTMARHMYLSQSTIRNHLASIFRKVGVHSQPELLERLRAMKDTQGS
jgi:DNA-binding CsgD family transcriptional regulator